MLLFFAGFFLAPENGIHKDIYYTVVVLPFILASAMFRDVFAPLRRQHIAAIVVLIGLALPVLWSPGLNFDSVIRVLRNVFYLSAFLIVVNYLIAEYPRFLDHAVLLLVVSALCVGVALLGNLVLNAPDMAQATLVPGWRFNNQNRMAKSYGLIVILCLGWLLVQRSRNYTILAGITFVVSACVIVLSRSKGATYALLLALPVLLIARHDLKVNLIRFWPGVVVFMALVIALAIEVGVISDFMADGWSRRDYIWLSLLESARDAPFFGTGYLLDPKIVGTDGVVYRHEHNLILSLLRQAGIVGVLLFLTSLGTLGYRAVKTNDARITLWLVLLIYGFFASMSGDKYPLIAPVEMWLWFWLPIAVLLALLSLPKANRQPLLSETKAALCPPNQKS